MRDDPEIRRARGRAAKQERSERTRGALVQAVVSVLADEGVAGLTHRLVAQRSGASLAATTYYFGGKPDMIAVASDALLRGYFSEFEQIVAGVSGGGPDAYRRFVAELAGRAMTDHRTSTIAWCEIMLDGARDPEGRTLARLWFERIGGIWLRAVAGFGLPEAAARSGMDVMLGALFHGLALGLGPEQMAATLGSSIDPGRLFPPPPAEPAAAVAQPPSKAAATRERILDAAIVLLSRHGAGAVNYRSVALEAGLTPGAPAYHFSSSEDLLAQAQAVLFARSEARYRDAIASASEGLDLATLVELTAVIFQSEATELGAQNLATFAIWLQAARQPDLRGLVQAAIGELCRAWAGLLAGVNAAMRGPEPLLMQYLFVGVLIRTLACGVTAMDLVASRAELKRELTALAEGRHWLQAEV
jgi:DNA-binding transcriptional regulator YbjK